MHVNLEFSRCFRIGNACRDRASRSYLPLCSDGIFFLGYSTVLARNSRADLGISSPHQNLVTRPSWTFCTVILRYRARVRHSL